MNRPLISIVLPVSNGERFLRQSIESCLCQSYDFLELLIVDDGSTDSTPAIIEEYLKRDSRVRVFSHLSNRGLPHALNTGFAAAAGKYLTWTSDDNYYRRNAMARMLEVLEGDAKIDFVHCDYCVVDSEDRVLETCAAGEMRELVFLNTISGCFLDRREVYEVLGKYDENMFLAEDYDFWLRVSARFRMVPLHEDLYCYRGHQNSLTVRWADRAIVVADRSLERNLPHLTWATQPDKARAYFMLARRAQVQGEWSRAWRHGYLAFRHAPLVSCGLLVQKILRWLRPAAGAQAR